jgi:hypothetical protein
LCWLILFNLIFLYAKHWSARFSSQVNPKTLSASEQAFPFKDLLHSVDHALALAVIVTP